MPDLKDFTGHLKPEDHTALAAALTTLYIERMGSSPRNPNWNDWWNSYSIGYIPEDCSFITVKALEGKIDKPNRSMILSVNTKHQAVTWEKTWEKGNRVSGVKLMPKLVPENLRFFLVELTNTVHDIAAKRVKALERKRKRKEKDEWKEAKKSYQVNKEIIDAGRELKKKNMEELEKKRKEIKLKEKLLCRKEELEYALRVMRWKASVAEQPTSLPVEKPTDEMLESTASHPLEKPTRMLESAKRGPKHDLCEECGGQLRFCTHKECTIIGCMHCHNGLTGCDSCGNVTLCDDHSHDLNDCFSCLSSCCKPCNGLKCLVCESFICYGCSKCILCDIERDGENKVFFTDYYKIYRRIPHR